MAAASAVLLVGLSSCGGAVVVVTAPEAPAYQGPLFVEVTASPTDEKADRSGAAGRVVDCDFPATGDSRPGIYDGGSVSRSPLAALSAAVEDAPRGGITHGFREIRRETDRVLYTFEYEQRIRVAYIVHRGPAVDGNTGWYVESWASCDWAELPPAGAEEIGLQIWTDTAGRRVPTARVVSGSGPEHCDWQAMTFLNLDGGDLEGGQTYVAHPDPGLYPGYFDVAYAEAARLPGGVTDTGFSLDGRQLWLANDGSRAYVGSEQSVEVWPATTQPLGCA
ncbi:MAG: hypothetical protein ABWY56_13595 [Propionibacteriaceae bacterium]